MEKFYWILTTFIFLADLAIRILLSLRIIMRKREASVTLAWLVVILLLPFAGAVIYLLLGENRLGQKRAEHAAAKLPVFKDWVKSIEQRFTLDWHGINPECRPIEQHARKVIGIPTLPGNELELFHRADTFFHALIEDIDRAREYCFLEFYIWEQKGLAGETARALIRAASRGVVCKILLDSIGSKEFLQSSLAGEMRDSGIEIIEAMPAGLFRALFVRIDLRNHRKIVVIDGKTAFTGSQNLVDPRYFKQDENVGEWIDTMVRIRGPAVEALFATFFYDWFVESGLTMEQMTNMARIPRLEESGEVLVQLVPSGPGFQREGIHDLLLTTIYAARRELVLTSPYFVPDNSILTALKSAAHRGVEVTIIVPDKNDSRLVHYASRARYSDLARSGVRIMAYAGGLLHAKTITVDRDFCLLGSVNLDMRSFWLNFELTLFIYNRDFTVRLRELQQQFIRLAHPLDNEVFARRSFFTRFKENCALLVGPLL